MEYWIKEQSMDVCMRLREEYDRALFQPEMNLVVVFANLTKLLEVSNANYSYGIQMALSYTEGKSIVA